MQITKRDYKKQNLSDISGSKALMFWILLYANEKLKQAEINSLPCKVLSRGMKTLDIISIQPKTTHVCNWSLSDDTEEFIVDIHNSSCSCIIGLPSIDWGHATLLQCEILKVCKYTKGLPLDWQFQEWLEIAPAKTNFRIHHSKVDRTSHHK